MKGFGVESFKSGRAKKMPLTPLLHVKKALIRVMVVICYVSSDFRRSLMLGLTVACWLSAECATAAPSGKTVDGDFVSSQTDTGLEQSKPFCDFALDPVAAAMSAGYVIKDGSPESWRQDEMNPPGNAIYEYVGSFFGPEYSNTRGPEFDAYDVSYYNAPLDSVVQKICRAMKDGWNRCFRKRDQPSDPSPSPNKPRDNENKDAIKKKACAAFAQAVYRTCLGCACDPGECQSYAQTYAYRNCMGLNPTQRPGAYGCALECMAANPVDYPDYP